MSNAGTVTQRMESMARAQRLVERCRQLERKHSYLRLAEAIEGRPLTRNEQTAMLGRIIQALATGKITPGESRKLTSLVTKGG